MQDFVMAKMFGTGQVTIPKKYRPEGSVNFTVRKKGKEIIFKPLEPLEIEGIEEIDLADDGEGWETLLDLRKEGGIEINKFSKMLKKQIAKESKKQKIGNEWNRKVLQNHLFKRKNNS